MARRESNRLALAITGLALLAIKYGFSLGARLGAGLRAEDLALLGFALFWLAGDLLSRRGPLRDFGADLWAALFASGYALALAVSLGIFLVGRISAWELYAAVYAASVVYISLSATKVMIAQLGSWIMSTFTPSLILPVSFLVVITVGTVMLILPGATREGISALDALFTAASATCVTGLIVVDTGTAFTTFGQLVIAILIQIGGLGLMTFVAFFTLYLSRSSVSYRHALSLSRVMDTDFVSDIKSMMGAIVAWTLSIEAAGAFLLYIVWRPIMAGSSQLGVIWHSIFHSISAFCNAGFSLNTTNLERFSGSPSTCLIMGTLIVLGGLGFGVLAALGATVMARVRSGRAARLSVQTRFVLLCTIVLVVGAFAAFLLLEWNNTLAGMTLGDRLANAYLQAVTPRTAGFNTVDTSSVTAGMQWLFVLLMFVGASPGSTGGGVKTSTLGLMLVALGSLLGFPHRRKTRGAETSPVGGTTMFGSRYGQRPTPELWNRRIPLYDFQRAALVVVLGGMLFGISSLLLLLTESGVESGLGPMDYIFETMSAFGTVGLSTGATGHLTSLGKLVIIFTMFSGRVGPATLAAATGLKRQLKYRYPEARITIG
ncbi:MAG: potassium transporter TrkG [Candidatus Fermentibacteraceae bacterium]